VTKNRQTGQVCEKISKSAGKRAKIGKTNESKERIKQKSKNYSTL
jgi:hypothetical protein